MSPRSRAERDAIADGEEAAELADHARLLNDSALLDDANRRLAEARERAASARADRLRGEEPTAGAEDTRRKIDELLDSAFTGLELVELEPFSRVLTAHAAVAPSPPASDRVALGDLMVNRVSLSAEEILVTVDSQDVRWDGQLAVLSVVGSQPPERYLIALYRERTGTITGCVRVISVAESVLMLGARDPLNPGKLGGGDLAAVVRSLRSLPPEARDAWRRIAALRATGDQLRDLILGELGTS
jgi:hypothetical protein